ncbi:MAG TPA: R3H domain-containing nucleic acid-binding protein [Vampirovibrionales bacterium]
MVNSQGNQPIDNPIQPQAQSGVENVDLGRTQITDDLSQLLEILPETIRDHLTTHSSLSSLVEVVMDLGRLPEARFPHQAEYISDIPVSRSDLKYAIERVGHFSGDNRAGIEQTLHRISAIRNRTGEIIGLTCRVGRSVFGTIHMIRDLVESGQSILMLGRPGVGKTTALREIARVLADELHKRVVIIDTSNEIAGDGDIPHPAIGRARRMQVAAPEFQHKVMIEAVENHMPEVIVIDEIGTELEALAARTIAERGVQLVGTAHGNQIENLIKNPTLCDLVGGIQSVTLGDEEARRRGSQKTVLERKAPPTFEIAVEMSERKRWVVHERVAETVDSLLRGRQPDLQVRTVSESGKVTITNELQPQNPTTTKMTAAVRPFGSAGLRASGKMQPLPAQTLPELGRRPKAVPEEKSFEQMLNESLYPSDRFTSAADYGFEEVSPLAGPNGEDLPLHIYPYGVSRHQLDQVIRTLALPVVVTKDIDSADVVLAVRSHVKNHSKLRQMSKNRQVPIFTINSSSVPKIAHSLRRMLHLEEGSTPEVSDVSLFAHSGSDDEIEALEEARLAVEQIVIPKGQPVELLPRGGQVRKMQHELVEHYRLKSCSFGDEPNRRLRIYPA